MEGIVTHLVSRAASRNNDRDYFDELMFVIIINCVIFTKKFIIDYY